MEKNENVPTDVLLRICKLLECNLDDVPESLDVNAMKNENLMDGGIVYGRQDKRQHWF